MNKISLALLLCIASSRSLASALLLPQGSPFGELKVGVIRLDGWGNELSTGTGNSTYVPIRGDVDDNRSYEKSKSTFSMVATIAEDCTWDSLKDPTLWDDQEHLDKIRDSVADAFHTLMKNDADVILANCGLFMWLHSKGIATPAMDMAMKRQRFRKKPRPIVSLSTLTTLPTNLALYGLGDDQRTAIANSEQTASKSVIVIFTSDENSCLAILNKTEQLKGTNIFVHSDPKAKKANGGILVVGLNKDDVVGTGKVDGFEIVSDGTPAFYDVLNPAIQKVAKAVKKQYPNVALGIVECTEVGAYTDTIRDELEVPVLDPIIMAANLVNKFVDHDYQQLSHSERQEYISDALSIPVNAQRSLYRYIAMIMYYTEKRLKQKSYPWPFSIGQKKYHDLLDGSLKGELLKEVLRKVVKKAKVRAKAKMIADLKKTSRFQAIVSILDRAKMASKMKMFDRVEHLIEEEAPEVLEKIMKEVLEKKAAFALEREIKDSMLELV